MLSFPTVKNRFPFALGSTSYIIPADIIPNVKLLSPLIDDIELILFQSPDFSNIPSKEDISVLKNLASLNKSSYTVHLPIDRKAGAPDKNERELFCNAVKQIVDRCSPLSPASWILHLEGITQNAEDILVNEWEKRCFDTITKIINDFPSPDLVAIENLNYPWYWHQNIASQFRSSLCCDVGHLWMNFEQHWKEHLNAMLPKTKVIHLHGVKDGKDHIALSEGNQEFIQSFLNIVRQQNYTGIITLEIFNENDLIKSIEVIDQLWEE